MQPSRAEISRRLRFDIRNYKWVVDRLALSASGEQMRDGDGNPLWVVPPNPEKAFNLFQSVVEYHVPKLARTEMTGANGGAITVASLDLKHLSDIELAQVSQLLLKADRSEPNVVDVTPE